MKALPKVVSRLVIEEAEASPAAKSEGLVAIIQVGASETAAVMAALIEGLVAASPDEGVALRRVVRVTS